jgi:ribosome biogenesis protein MAK21
VLSVGFRSDVGPRPHCDPRQVYVASFNTAVQALQVLMQATAVGALAGESGAGGSSTRAASGFGTDVPPVPSTRFYRALYAKLASPDLRVSNKHSLFLNLLFKAVKADPLPARAAAFLKRLLQVAASSPVSFAAGALILVSEVLAARENVWRLLTSPPKPDKPSKPGGGAGGGEKDGEDDSGSDEGASGDPSGSDEEAGGHTVKAGARVTLTGLVGAAHLNGMQGVARELDGDRWVVVVRGEAAPLRVKPQNLRPAQGAGNAAAGGLGAATAAAAAADPALAHLLRYDPMKREPEHAGAAGAQLWELVALQAHFHPTIRHFTAQLLKRARITYPGDPLEDFTAMRFLDKFVYKNPKKRRGKGDGDGSDDEEEARPVSRMAKDKGPGRESEPVVNSVEWMQRSSEALAPEDMFFFRYFSQKDERQSDAKRKAKAKEMDERREREEMEEVEAVTGVEDSGDSGSEGSDGEAAFSASGSEESDVDSSDEEVMDMGGGSGAEVDDDDSDGEDMDMGGGFAAEEEAEASGEEDSEDGYSDMEDISDDEAPVKGKKVASKGDAEQEMMREIEAGIGSDDSDVEFNTRLQAGGGGNWKDEGEDMDNDSDDSSAGGEEAMGGMFHEGDHSDEDGDARGGKKARKGKGAVFASADDYAHLLENDPGSGGESDDQMGGRRGGGRGGGRGRGRGAGNRGRGGAGRGRGR